MTPSENTRSRSLKIALVVLASCLLIFSASFLLWNSSIIAPQGGQPTETEVPKAAVLDALYASSPNLAFEQNVVGNLSGAGFQVDVFRGENVTIPLLRNVDGYKFLVLRLHSAVHSDGFLYLFSGERYSTLKYETEQLSGSVRKGVTFEGQEFFALNAVFLGSDKRTSLNGSTIILMGCNGTGDPYSLRRLFEKGAKEYVAWTGYVDLSHSDEAVLALIRGICYERLRVKEAVEKVMREVGPDPFSKSVLEYHTP